MTSIDNDLIVGGLRAQPLLPADGYITKTSMASVAPSAAYTKTSFTGDGVFQFTVPSGMVFIPSRSYFSIETKITIGNAQPTLASDVAPAFNMAHNLFESMNLELDQKVISRINAGYPQVAAYLARTQMPKQLQDALAPSHFLETDFEARRARIASDGILIGSTQKLSAALIGSCEIKGTSLTTITGTLTTLTTQLQVGDQVVIGGLIRTITVITSDLAATVGAAFPGAIAATAPIYKYITTTKATARSHINELTMVPALDVFQDPSVVLPAASYRLTTTCVNDVAKNALESSAAALVIGAAATQADFEVSNIRFNACFVEYNDDRKTAQTKFAYTIRTSEVKRITHALASDVEYQVNLNPATDKISVAITDGNSGHSTMYPPSLFVGSTGTEFKMSNLSIEYAGQVKPVNQRSLLYGSSATNKYLLAYLESMNSNGLGLIGGEPFSDWMARGPIQSFGFQKAHLESGPVATIRMKTSDATASYLLVFAEYPRSFVVDLDTRSGASSIKEEAVK